MSSAFGMCSTVSSTQILVGSNDGAIRAIDLRTGTEVQKAEVQGREEGREGHPYLLRN